MDEVNSCPKTDHIRLATEEDIPGICRMIREAGESSPCREWFIPDSEEEIRETIQGKGYVLLLEEEGETAGLLVMIRPGEDDVYTRYVDGADGSNTIHTDTCVVAPAFRGRGIQKRMFLEAEARERKAGTRFLMCTIHPDNAASLKSALHTGYEIAHTSDRVYENGYLRHVMVRRLEAE